jgi:hypothetical protein
MQAGGVCGLTRRQCRRRIEANAAGMALTIQIVADE